MEGAENLSWRVHTLERDVAKLQEGKPEVIADRVNRLAEDVRDLRDHLDEGFDAMRKEIRAGDQANTDELGTQRKILISAWITIATGLIVAYVLGNGGVPS